MPPGDRLKSLCASATNSVVFVAPFIKNEVLKALLSTIPAVVSKIQIITRWWPEDVAAGVSDLEVFDTVCARPGVSLLIHPWLHGKFYRVDDQCLIGSANLTFRGLGWANPSNLELLMAADASHPDAVAFERNVFAAAILATEALRDAIRDKASSLCGSFCSIGDVSSPEHPDRWTPSCATPDRLWNVYADHETWRLVGSAIEAAKIDLSVLRIPAGLSRPQFTQCVGAILAVLPIVQEVEALLDDGVSDEIGIDLVEKFQSGEKHLQSASERWSTLKVWLQYFRPLLLRPVAATEMLVRGRQLL